IGLNEFAGYVAVAAAAWATGWIAATYGLRPQPFYIGVFVVVIGLGLSIFLVRETTPHVRLESTTIDERAGLAPPDVFWRTTVAHRTLRSTPGVGLVNNLNDALAWGFFPLVFAAPRLDLATIGWLAALYPATWGLMQLATGALSDRVGRKLLIVGG